MDRLSRIRLLMGDAAVARLQNAAVMVVGCGAVGSFAIEALARSGIGHLILVDFDRVEASNINRQLFALQSTIGQLKTDVARARIADIDPNIVVDTLPIFFDENTTLDARPDFVIDAIDTIDSKIALYKWCAAHNIPFAASMGAARKMDCAQIKVAPISKTTVCPLAARVRRLVRDAGLADFPAVYSTESPAAQVASGRSMGSIITITGAFGLRLAGIAINHLTQNA